MCVCGGERDFPELVCTCGLCDPWSKRPRKCSNCPYMKFRHCGCIKLIEENSPPTGSMLWNSSFPLLSPIWSWHCSAFVVLPIQSSGRIPSHIAAHQTPACQPALSAQEPCPGKNNRKSKQCQPTYKQQHLGMPRIYAQNVFVYFVCFYFQNSQCIELWRSTKDLSYFPSQ